MYIIFKRIFSNNQISSIENIKIKLILFLIGKFKEQNSIIC
jgi:hypothetical protein